MGGDQIYNSPTQQSTQMRIEVNQGNAHMQASLMKYKASPMRKSKVD